MSGLRGLDPAIKAHLASRKIRTAFFIEADISGNLIRLTTHSRDVEWSGNTFFRGRTLVIEGVNQTLTLENQESTVSLSGIPSDYKNLVFNQDYVGRTMTIWQGFFDWDTDALIMDPVQVHSGPIVGMNFTDDIKNGTSSITLPVSNAFSRFNDKKSMMTNPSTHKRLFPNDRIFDQVPALVDRVIEIGKL